MLRNRAVVHKWLCLLKDAAIPGGSFVLLQVSGRSISRCQQLYSLHTPSSKRNRAVALSVADISSVVVVESWQTRRDTDIPIRPHLPPGFSFVFVPPITNPFPVPGGLPLPSLPSRLPDAYQPTQKSRWVFQYALIARRSGTTAFPMRISSSMVWQPSTRLLVVSLTKYVKEPNRSG